MAKTLKFRYAKTRTIKKGFFFRRIPSGIPEVYL